MPWKPQRFPRPLTILMVALALSGFALSFTHSITVLKVYGVIYVLAFVAWTTAFATPARVGSWRAAST